MRIQQRKDKILECRIRQDRNERKHKVRQKREERDRIRQDRIRQDRKDIGQDKIG